MTSTATKQCISIPIIDDSIDESEQECFIVSFSESSGTSDITVNPVVVTLCINDTDGEFVNPIYACGNVFINYYYYHILCTSTFIHGYMNIISLVDSALVVGFEQTAYTIDEVDGYQLVCIDVLSGDVDGREIVLDYSTTSGTASM